MKKESPLTPVQLCLRWILSFPEVSTVVPSVKSLEELEEGYRGYNKGRRDRRKDSRLIFEVDNPG